MRKKLNIFALLSLLVGNLVFAKSIFKISMENAKYYKKQETEICKKYLYKYKPNEITTAAHYGCVKQLLKLIEQGYDVNYIDTHGGTPLYNAISNYKIKILHILLENGADPNLIVPGFDQQTLLAYTAMSYPGLKIVHNASEVRIYILKLLLTYGADVNLLDESPLPSTPLYSWTARGNMEGVTILLKAGADVHGSGGTPPIMGVGSEEVLEILLRYGADIEFKNQYGKTVLHGAVESGTPDVVKAVIEHGIDVNTQMNGGETPLIWCVRVERIDLLTTLLKLGADSKIKTKNGLTAYSLAKQLNNKKALVIFEENGIYQ